MPRLRVVNAREERGASAVLLAVMLVVLLGFGALAVDVGGLYVDRKELQNGADAAALAIAQSCTSADGCDVSEADVYATANKADANAVIEEVNVGPGSVFVRVSSVRSLWLAQAMGRSEATVDASAEVSWYTNPSRLTTLPLAVSYCEFFWQNGLTLDAHEEGVGTSIKIKLLKGSASKGGPAWGDEEGEDCTKTSGPDAASGGFGFLQADATCTAEISLGTVDSKTGMLPCVSDVLAIGDTVVLPIFDRASGNGTNGSYNIIGFAALYITDFQLDKGLGNAFIEGDFVAFGTLEDLTGTSGGTDFGVSVIEFTR